MLEQLWKKANKYKHDYAPINYKVQRKIEKIVSKILGDYHKTWRLYKVYWHKKRKIYHSTEKNVLYLTQEPNYMAGFGHGISVWRHGIGLANYMHLAYAYSSMVNKDWDRRLGFGEREEHVGKLIRDGYKVVKLPYFDPNNEKDLKEVREWIGSYRGDKIVFLTAFEQPGISNLDAYERAFLRKKFFESEERNNDCLIFNHEYFNIAVHIRRGDIVSGLTTGNPEMLKRWLDEEYYYKVINELKDLIRGKELRFYIFSDGSREDFKKLSVMDNVFFLMEMDVINSFIHLCRADILVTGLSAFSRIAGYINPNYKIGSDKLWRGYPEDGEWLIADAEGHLSENEKALLRSRFNTRD